MIITQLKRDDKSNKAKVYIDGEYHFTLNIKVLAKYKLEEGQAIDENLYEDFN